LADTAKNDYLEKQSKLAIPCCRDDLHNNILNKYKYFNWIKLKLFKIYLPLHYLKKADFFRIMLENTNTTSQKNVLIFGHHYCAVM